MRAVICAAMAALPLIAACASGGAGSGEGSMAGGPDREVPVRIRISDGVNQAIDVVTEDGLARAWVETSPDLAWQRLPEVYATLGFGAEDFTALRPGSRTAAAEKEQVRRLVGTRPSRFLNCGASVTMDRADNGQVHLWVTTRLVPENEGTTVLTRVEAVSTDTETGEAVQCSSRGRLEAMIVEHLAGRSY